MTAIIGAILLVSVYVLVYYRLMVRFYYQKQHDITESTFGALFSLPPYGRLCEKGKRYARRYWGAVAVMVGMIVLGAVTLEFPGLTG